MQDNTTQHIPFLIVSTRRVGSTALSLILSRSNDISCFGEMIYQGEFYPKIRSKHILVSSNTSINSVIASSQTKVRGCKFTIPDYQHTEIDSICNLIVEGNVKTIHLSRNLLEQFVSLKQAQNTGVWHVKKEPLSEVPHWVDANEHLVEHRPIESNLDEIERFCRHVIVIDRKLSGLMHQVPYLKVDHTQLNNSEMIGQIFRFLDASIAEVFATELQKTTRKHIQQIEHIQGAVDIFERYEQNRQ